MTSFTPTPTEYHGTVFRSKSEALFARVLDITLDGWVYEPKWISDTDGWVPDFFVLGGDSNRPRAPAVIEYKPRRPTQTYLNRLSQRMTRINERFGFLWICAYGSFFEEPLAIELLPIYPSGQGRRVRFVGADVMLNAMEYRFDLQASDAA